MSKAIEIKTPLEAKVLKRLRAGQEVLISGTIYTARDQAHRRLTDLIKKRKKLPIPLQDQLIYYCGPTPTPKGKRVGAAGPTTSSRMDHFTPLLLAQGVKATLGKGRRGPEVKAAQKKFGAVYLAAIGGTAAYLAQFIKSSKLVAFADLGPEAIYRMEVRDLPALVINDLKGRDLYEEISSPKK